VNQQKNNNSYRQQGNNRLQQAFLGYISNARIINGTALYTSNFVPSTTPLAPVANTVLR
jgi:hypothetical protein